MCRLQRLVAKPSAMKVISATCLRKTKSRKRANGFRKVGREQISIDDERAQRPMTTPNGSDSGHRLRAKTTIGPLDVDQVINRP